MLKPENYSPVILAAYLKIRYGKLIKREFLKLKNLSSFSAPQKKILSERI